jgi:hypothetical protein
MRIPWAGGFWTGTGHGQGLAASFTATASPLGDRWCGIWTCLRTHWRAPDAAGRRLQFTLRRRDGNGFGKSIVLPRSAPSTMAQFIGDDHPKPAASKNYFANEQRHQRLESLADVRFTSKSDQIAGRRSSLKRAIRRHPWQRFAINVRVSPPHRPLTIERSSSPSLVPHGGAAARRRSASTAPELRQTS